ncbi:hypothetical protein Dimus_016420 [Dionaea muscipula]
MHGRKIDDSDEEVGRPTSEEGRSPTLRAKKAEPDLRACIVCRRWKKTACIGEEYRALFTSAEPSRSHGRARRGVGRARGEAAGASSRDDDDQRNLLCLHVACDDALHTHPCRGHTRLPYVSLVEKMSVKEPPIAEEVPDKEA